MQYVFPIYLLPEQPSDPAAVSGYGQLYAKTDGELYFEDASGTVTEVSSFKSADRSKLDGIETGATADQTGAEISGLLFAEDDTNNFTDALLSKLNGIEANATADQTGAEIKAALFAENDTNNFTDADHSKLDGIATGATANSSNATLLARANHTGTQAASTISDFDTEVSNNTDVAANTTARHTHANQAVLDATTAAFTSADETKLDGIEAGATADLTGAEIKTLLFAEDDTNNFGDNFASKLSAIEVGATADQTGAEIKALYEAEANTNAFTDADHSKLDGIEAGATANSSDATLLARANHTGTQSYTTITGIGSAATYDAPASGDANAFQVVRGNDTRLTNARTPAAHTHTASEISDFDTEVSNNTDVAANTSARHSHSNKATLDLITAAFTTADETKLDVLTHSSGLIGVGVTTPQTILHVGNATPILRISDTDSASTTAAAPYIQLFHGENTTAIGYIGFTSTGDANMEIRNFLTGDLEFWTNNSLVGKFQSGGAFQIRPGSSVTPDTNSSLAWEITNNTTVTIKVKGSDGVVRSGTIALS